MSEQPTFPLSVENQERLYSIAERIHEILLHPTAPVTAFEMFELGDVLKLCRGERVDRVFDAGRFDLG